jgi:ubiquinone/menaquinone biosynthesis C-methylase UbiE
MSSAQVSRGLRWPRFYDLMVLVLTRGRDRVYREKLLDLAGIGPGDNVLDIGSGTGTLAISAWRRVRPTGSVTGTDISKPMLAAARRKSRRAGAEIAFMEADATSLPFADASFDVVLMTTVMHMVPTAGRPKVLGEMARVLKPGGRALLVDYGGPLEARRKMSARHGAHGSFDLYGLEEDMKEAGFSNVRAGPTGWLDLHFLCGEAG